MSDSPSPAAGAPIADPVTGAFPDTSGMPRVVARQRLDELRAAAFADPRHPLVNEHALGRKAVVEYHARLGAIAYGEDSAAPSAAEQQPAPAPVSPTAYIIPEEALAPFVASPEEIPVADAGVRNILSRMGAPPSFAEMALDHARLASRQDAAREVAQSEEILRTAWRDQFEQNRARVLRWLDHHGARELAEISGMARSAVGMQAMLNLAARQGF